MAKSSVKSELKSACDICIATAAVTFVFSLYFLVQYRLHLDMQKR